jgi:hypothetical protein
MKKGTSSIAELPEQNSAAKTICENSKARIMEPAVNARRPLRPTVWQISP